MKKWGDLALHRAGCPYKGVAVYGNEEEITKYYSGNCPGCNVIFKWEERDPLEKSSRLDWSPRMASVARKNQTG